MKPTLKAKPIPQAKNPKGVDIKSTGEPETGAKTSGIKIRGTGAATKGVMARGPMA